MRFTSCLAVALMVACARVEEPAPRIAEVWETAAGSRLHPIFIETGGVRSFLAFEDRARGERCYPSEALDGTRCVPRILDAGMFADASCTQPTVALDDSCDDARKLVRVGRTVFRGAALARAFRVEGSSCQPVELPEGIRFVTATEERVSDTDFVSFEPREVDVGGRLKVWMLIGDDGSRFYAGLRDTTLDTDCAFETASDGVLRCLPPPVTLAWDETCTHRVVAYRPGTAPPRAVTAPRDLEERCMGLHSFRATDVGTIQRKTIDKAGNCIAQGSPSPSVRLEEELSPESFERETAVRVGEARIKQWVRTIGKATIPSSRLEDSQLGANCNFAFDTGAYRCLPAAASAESYADATCTTPIACLYASCGEPPRFALERVNTCAYNVHALGAVIPPPEREFASWFGSCIPRSGLTCDERRAVGPIVPRSSLATGSVVSE